MSIERRVNTKTYSFKSVGNTVELKKKLANSDLQRPPVGIKTPVALSEKGGAFLEMHDNFPDQIHDNLLNLILCNHGERLGLPDFGANLMELTFELQESDTQSEAMSRINSAVSKYMPYVSLETFTPVIELFDNKEVAKIGVNLGYTIPKLRTDLRQIEVILYSAG
jgi:phage baseplate assembly protein W